MPPNSLPWHKEHRGDDELPVEPVEFARRLRKNSTDAEPKLWALLRNRRFRGFKFRRQHPVPPYVLDFFCEELNLAIELDGGGHASDAAVEYDKRRTRCLNHKGIKVLRLTNNEMLVHTESAMDWLWHQVESLVGGSGDG